MSELLNGLRTNCSNPDWITVELRRTVTGYLYEIFCSASTLTLNSLSAIPSWPKPRTTRGFALRAPDCAHRPPPQKPVSRPFCLTTS